MIKKILRKFSSILKELQNLKFNSNGLPTYENQIAGINACYTFNKKRT